jgi:hypothetical protein
MAAVPRSVEELGLAPTFETVDHWLTRDFGFYKIPAGKSFQNRDLFLYSNVKDNNQQQLRANNKSQHTQTTVLFLSLVHGNEPAGLLSLLWTAQFLYKSHNNKKVRLLFFPFVNLDAYVENTRLPNGCRRTNLRPTCASFANETTVHACPAPSRGGVDLNRNHPSDWNQDDDALGGPLGLRTEVPRRGVNPKPERFGMLCWSIKSRLP